MKNRVRYFFRVKISHDLCKVIVIYILFFLCDYIILRDIDPSHKSKFYELFYWHMGNTMRLPLFHSAFLFFITYRFMTDNKYDTLFILKYKNRTNLFLYKMVSILMITIIYIGTAVLVSLLQSIPSMNQQFEWTSFTLYLYGSICANHLELQDIFIPFLLNLFFYMITVCLLLLILDKIFRKKYLPVVIMTGFCLVNYSMFLMKIKSNDDFCLLGNVMINYNEYKLNSSFNLNYWLPVVAVLAVIYYLTIRKTDIVESRI